MWKLADIWSSNIQATVETSAGTMLWQKYCPAIGAQAAKTKLCLIYAALKLKHKSIFKP